MPLEADQLPITTIIERARASRAPLEQLLATISADDMLVEHDAGWSVKDVLVHLTFWEAYALTQLRIAANGGTPESPEAMTNAQMDTINTAIITAGRARTLENVRVEFAQIHADLLAVADAIPPDESDPWWRLWSEPHAPKRWLFYVTYNHYDEHLADLRGWLGENDSLSSKKR